MTDKEPGSCSGGYPKPSWQTGSPSPDGKRDMPDFAIFAGDGTLQNFYLYCNRIPTPPTAWQPGARRRHSRYPLILGVGGTSVSAEVSAGMVALLNQSTGSAQGLVNTNLYALAGQSWANCQSGSAQTSACVFNQVSGGTIAMRATPCQRFQWCDRLQRFCQWRHDRRNYEANNQTLAYNAGAGYNLGTGLGSLNVASLVNEWNVGSGGAADSSFLRPCSGHGQHGGWHGNYGSDHRPGQRFNDTVDFSSTSCAGLPTGATCSFTNSPVSANGTTTLTITRRAAATPPAVRPLTSGRWTTGAFVSLACGFGSQYFAHHLRQESPLEHRRSLRRLHDGRRHRSMRRRRLWWWRWRRRWWRRHAHSGRACVGDDHRHQHHRQCEPRHDGVTHRGITHAPGSTSRIGASIPRNPTVS